MTKEETRKALLEPFPPENVHWRIRTKLGNDHAFVLAYIDARDVMDRLDDVLGVGCWSREQQIVDGNHICTIKIESDSMPYVDEDGDTCYWQMKCSVSDVAEPTDIEAQKGGASDSFKRAAVNLGIARVYYTLGDTKVKLEDGKIPAYEITRLRNEVLIPAYKKFAKEYGLDDSKWVVKDEKAKPEAATALSDETMAAWLAQKRNELYFKMVDKIGADKTGEFLNGLTETIGKWATLDILSRVAYIRTLSEKVDSLIEGEPKPKAKKSDK